MDELVEAARKYLGKKFRHRGRGPTHYDCIGLAGRVMADIGQPRADRRDYGREPDPVEFGYALNKELGRPVAGPFNGDCTEDALRVGDIVTMRTEAHPHHVAIVGDYELGGLSLIHASGEHRAVVEHRLSPEYMRRIVRVYRRNA